MLHIDAILYAKEVLPYTGKGLDLESSWSGVTRRPVTGPIR
jgi:hypothetical protein